MIDTRQINSMSDFVRNPRAHVARLKETHIPEVLTINGRAEVVMLDTETYEHLMERLQTMEKIAALRVHLAESDRNTPPHEPAAEAEIERRQAIVREIMDETERLGLYR